MSFGYSIGDFIAVVGLARTVWGRFKYSPSQFKAIKKESLCVVLDEIANNFTKVQMEKEQADHLSQLMRDCRDVLNELDSVLQKNASLGNHASNISFTAEQYWRRLNWDQSTTNEWRDRISSLLTLVNTFNTSLASQIIQTTCDQVGTLDERVQSLQLNVAQSERRDILTWLSPLNFKAQQHDLSTRRQATTGMWLLEDEDFERWSTIAGETLVCRGMPGAGKTMLASLVVDHLEDSPIADTVSIVYIYCDYKREEEQTSFKLIANLVKQLLQQRATIPDTILKLYNHHHEKGTFPRMDEILRMLSYSVPDNARTYIIVDALDELQAFGGTRRTLLAHIRTLQATKPVNLMVTSRDIPLSDLDFRDPTYLTIQASPEDVALFVRGNMDDLAECVHESTDLQQDIVRAIVDAAKGMFLLARLYVNSLRYMYNAYDIEQALQQLPTGSDALNLAYESAMQRITNQKQGASLLAIRTLSWVIYAERLMTVREIRYALAIEHGEAEPNERRLSNIKDILSVCGGLVIVDEQTQAVRPVHYTTQEYLKQNGDKIFPGAPDDIAARCLTYLQYDVFGRGWCDPKTVKTMESSSLELVICLLLEYPFAEYAITYWLPHVRKCTQQMIRDSLVKFLRDDYRICSVAQVSFHLKGPDPLPKIARSLKPFTAMHVLPYFEADDIMSMLLHDGVDPNIRDQNDATPLWWAAKTGHEPSVKLLLSQQSINPNIRDYNDETTPLWQAVKYDRQAIVKLLLAREDINVNLSSELMKMSPLTVAIDENNNEIVEMLLLREGVDVNSRDLHGRTPLILAVDRGASDKVVKLLLSRTDLDVNRKNNLGRSDLYEAAWRGSIESVKLLLAHAETDLDTTDNQGRGIIFQVEHRANWTIQYRHDEMNWPENECDPEQAGREAALELIRTAMEKRSQH